VGVTVRTPFGISYYSLKRTILYRFYRHFKINKYHTGPVDVIVKFYLVYLTSDDECLLSIYGTDDDD